VRERGMDAKEKKSPSSGIFNEIKRWKKYIHVDVRSS
jgi:hypothetical protein